MAARRDPHAGMRLIKVEAGRRIKLPSDAVHALRARAGDRLLVLHSGPGLLLIKEDPVLRRLVEHNELVLKRKGRTVADILRALRKNRQAGVSHARSPLQSRGRCSA